MKDLLTISLKKVLTVWLKELVTAAASKVLTVYQKEVLTIPLKKDLDFGNLVALNRVHGDGREGFAVPSVVGLAVFRLALC